MTNLAYYQTSYRGQNLEELGIYVVDHDAFKVPPLNVATFDTDLGGGDEMQYAEFSPKEINLSLYVENQTNPDTRIRNLIELFMTPGRLIFEERPDRFIDCRLDGSIEVKDTPSYTEVRLKLLAEFPFFLGLDEHDVEVYDEIVPGGNTLHYPAFKITGPVENPYIKIITSEGVQLKTFNNISLGASDILVLNCRTNIALFNGTPISSSASAGVLRLYPESNRIETNAPNLRIIYRDTYL